MKRRILSGLAATAGALALVATGGLAAADPALGNIKEDRDAKLTIHKYLGLPTGGANDGSELTDGKAPGLDPGVGIKFDIYMVGTKDQNGACEPFEPLDLTTVAGWELAEKAITAQPKKHADFCYEILETVETGNDGSADLEVEKGLYYVKEVTDTENQVVQEANPFYVTLPMPKNNEWLYDVHVYPKNQIAEKPGKKIGDDVSAVVKDGEVTWTITSQIPKIASGETFTEASFYDVLDPRLEHVSSTVKIGENDLEVEFDDTDGKLTWTVKKEDLKKLDENQGKTITITVTTKVTDLGEGEELGEIANSSYGVSYNGKEIPGEASPYTYWGQLEILKLDASGGKVLEGAKFAVHELGEGETCPADPEEGTAVAKGKSNNKGVVIWDETKTGALGLWVGNSEEANGDLERDYCVYETEAPAGYTASKGAEKVTFKSGDNIKKLEVKNTQKDGPKLPLTGANGTTLLIIVGSALVLLALGWHLVRRGRAVEA